MLASIRILTADPTSSRIAAIVVRAEDERVVGVHIVGPDAPPSERNILGVARKVGVEVAGEDDHPARATDGLGEEPLAGPGLRDGPGVGHLDGDLARMLQVLGEINLTHASFAEWREQFVWANALHRRRSRQRQRFFCIV